MRKIKKEIYRGFTSIFSFLMILIIFGTTIALQMPTKVNNFLGISSTVKIVDTDEDSGDTVYYKTGEESDDIYDIDALNAMEKSVADEIVAQAEEGIALLKNDNGALPLAKDSKITLLGSSTVNMYYGKLDKGGGGGDGVPNIYADWTDSYGGYTSWVYYIDAMAQAFDINTALTDAYSANSETYPGRGVQEDANGNVIDAEAPASFYTSELTDTFGDYGDAAVIALTREGSEGNDLSMTGGVDGGSVLALQPNERALLEMVQSYKEDGTFKKVIVILNTDWALEIGELKDYGVDAILWIGNVGTQGMTGVVNVLDGDVSPSGHLVDTYAANSLSAPACMNANDNTQYWTNADEVLDYCEYTEADYSGEQNFTSYIVNAEGIYIGYKYYETRYEDCILGQGNASGSAGVYSGEGSWNYNSEVVYPFGYGLSYTTFAQELGGVTYDAETDMYEVEVTVTNTGDVYSGKSVVQIYGQTPYGDYEKENGIEKAAVQLVGFAKTDTLSPGESETVTVEVERYFLASYDSKGAGGYIMSSGDYYLAVGDDAHDALNNILAAKSAEGMTDVLGNDAAGSQDKVYTWTEEELDADSYRNSRVDDSVEVTNQFEDADLNYWLEGTVTYLSRSDWEGTYPITYTGLAATEEMMKVIKGEYEQPENSPSVDEFEQGADNGITFAMMMDVDYEDEETWNEFLDQFTVDDMLKLAADSFGSEAVESVGIPAAKRADDNAGIQEAGFVAPEESGLLGQHWNGELVTAATFNTERFSERGRLLGAECYFMGYNECWYGGGNIHRTPFGGRNEQYYSEDAILGYFVGAKEAEAMQGVGVMYCVKHFAGNNQETNRESLGTFFQEQSFREIDLRAFEGAFVEGKTYSVMGAFNRLGCLYAQYSGNLMTQVLRNEWGFEGHVTPDAIAGSLYKQNWALSLSAGTDYYCFNNFISMMGTGDDCTAGIKKLIDAGDGYILQLLREATKHNVNAYLHTLTINGLSKGAEIIISTPWWKYALNALIGIFAVLTAAAFAGYVLSAIKENRRG